MLNKFRTWAAGVLAPQNNSGGWINGDSQTYQDVTWWAPSYAGQVVTKETAMRVSAVFACVRLLAGSVSTIPIKVYSRSETGREVLYNDPLFWLLNERASERFTASTMWQYITKSVYLRGDGFCWIKRNRAGVVTGLMPLDPDKVIVERDGDVNKYYVQDGERRYGVDQGDILHFPGFGFDGTRSMSVIQWAAKQSIGIAMAAEEHSARFFSNGMSPSYAITSPGKMRDDQVDRLRQQVAEKAGGTANAHKPLVLTEGLDIKDVSLSATDGQLMDARKFQVIDIARAFGVPPHMIGATEVSSSWGTGIAEMSQGYVKYVLKPVLKMWQDELNSKLYGNYKKFAEFDYSDLLKGDPKSQAEFYRQAVGGSQGPGWMTIDEVRHELNMPPIEGGNKLYNPNQGTPNANPEAAPAGD